MKINEPTDKIKTEIEQIIKNTRRNNLKWQELSSNELIVTNPETLIGKIASIDITGNKNNEITLKRWSDTGALETGIRYSMIIASNEITSEYKPINTFGQYLFCEENKLYD